jgi:hypothetical protein
METLKQARESGNLEQFIAEREAEAKALGDADAFNRGVASMARNSKAVPAASPKEKPDD